MLFGEISILKNAKTILYLVMTPKTERGEAHDRRPNNKNQNLNRQWEPRPNEPFLQYVVFGSWQIIGCYFFFLITNNWGLPRAVSLIAVIPVP